MLEFRKGAITGGLSCGKSSVCRILKELGVYVISADEVVHQLLSSDTSIIRAVVELLGQKILVENRIDRSLVAEIVFHDAGLLQALETLLHPAVYAEINNTYRKQQNNSRPPPLFIAEVPLLFESGGDVDYDFTITVIADPEISFRRFNQQTKRSRGDFERRMARQLPPLEKAMRSQYVLMNSNSLSNLQEVTKELYQELIEDI